MAVTYVLAFDVPDDCSSHFDCALDSACLTPAVSIEGLFASLICAFASLPDDARVNRHVHVLSLSGIDCVLASQALDALFGSDDDGEDA